MKLDYDATIAIKRAVGGMFAEGFTHSAARPKGFRRVGKCDCFSGVIRLGEKLYSVKSVWPDSFDGHVIDAPVDIRPIAKTCRPIWDAEKYI